MSSKTGGSQPYNESIFMTTHNSYQWSLTEQLDQGIRGFELDIHDSWTLREIILGKISGGRYKGKFKVGHLWPGNEVKNKRRGGNPWGNNLEKWLGKIADWSREQEREGKEHAPITVFLDIKKNLIDTNNIPSEQFGLIRLNEQILNVFKDDQARLFSKGNFTEFYQAHDSWPTIQHLRNKIIVVLMGFHTLSRLIKEKLRKQLSYKGAHNLSREKKEELREQLSSMGIHIPSNFLEGEPREKPSFFKRARIWLSRLVVKSAKWIEEVHLLPFLPDPVGSLKTRVAYQERRTNSDKNFDPICWVAFNPEDQDSKGFEPSLKTKSLFVTAYPPENYSTYREKGKIVRTDYCKEESWPPFPEYVNFPATDDWRDDRYQEATTKWVKDKCVKDK